jgi:hypothetical protein
VYKQVPVRAVVLPLLDHEAAMQLHAAVRHALQQVLAEDSVWYQDDATMHATLYHASTHGVSGTCGHAVWSWALHCSFCDKQQAEAGISKHSTAEASCHPGSS